MSQSGRDFSPTRFTVGEIASPNVHAGLWWGGYDPTVQHEGGVADEGKAVHHYTTSPPLAIRRQEWTRPSDSLDLPRRGRHLLLGGAISRFFGNYILNLNSELEKGRQESHIFVRERMLLGLPSVGNQTGDEIDDKVGRAPMTGVFNLCRVPKPTFESRTVSYHHLLSLGFRRIDVECD
jgi:hypothetical protein